MRKLFVLGIVIAAAAAPSGAFAMSKKLPAKSVDVAAEPVQLEYSCALKKRGAVELAGLDAASGRAFRLKVHPSGYVTGTVDRVPVQYQVAPGTRDCATMVAGGGM